jgi:hypothetical protein
MGAARREDQSQGAARSLEDHDLPGGVCGAIGQILGTVTSNECQNYFTEAGYAQPKFIPL